MSYLGQSTLGIVCKGEKSVRERESDTITAIIEQKKKKSDLTLIKQMVPTETLYLVLCGLKLTLKKRAALHVWLCVNELLCICD